MNNLAFPSILTKITIFHELITLLFYIQSFNKFEDYLIIDGAKSTSSEIIISFSKYTL